MSAEDLKNQGNKALLSGHYNDAVDLYTQAIELNPQSAVYYANRAQAHIKNEAYGVAIEDSSKAIELDPTYIKAYFRRAVSNTAIIKHKDALVDFKKVVQLAPGDNAAKQRLNECQKLVRKAAFALAIAVEEGPALSEQIDLDVVKIDNNYDGVKIDDGYDENDKPVFTVTQKFIDDLVERFKNGKLLHLRYVYAIVVGAIKLFKEEPTMVETPVPEGTTTTVCGDTHGQFFDLLEIFKLNGWPSATHRYVFNGDFVDRGSWSAEIAILLYALKLLNPSSIYLNRGNHETDDMNAVYGFEGEIKHKYNERTFKLFSESFSALPLAHLIGGAYFVVHGGLFSKDGVTLDDIRAYSRFSRKQPGNSGLMMEMLWTDPQPENGRSPSQRGVGIRFGPDVTEAFCKENGLKGVLRSHEVRMGGYEVEHNGKLVTVFSAPNYCDSQGNKGAYINIGHDLEMQFNVFDAQPHPDVKPMAYSNRLMG
ncbi:Metallo-dependent phosphatase-like protein [Yarrowia lipolytica]|jgi:serine/threonine-protein phosphatase 5|uniref:Serine/threonine-protein phosphatase n=1 Tax=Yarrowia lipolytica TaxID=4952 RepID=A0A371C3K6_YARLL|nr:Serine/threonine-protein phosphatase T [Yarrowia lipolytica]RDW24590.1 Metallo-dependent phosphatase-like protein [Yarrowia lipolytica]RDW34798.1 Metallo-dependent phosphatase-like protein [Yarrowia lipolytica]RDW38564.1 Metallo-dependent phosphatase-like protein [Yarrowia lipolytica]RDW46629.1 Metallo-dependent phosphatase-like protein [Yarrowia lipolytica]